MIIVIDEHNVFKIEIGSLDDVGFGLVFARIFCEDVRKNNLDLSSGCREPI